MKIIKKTRRFFRTSVFAFMFAVCMVMGIAPVIPRRKEQFEIEVKMEDGKKEIEMKESIILNKADS